MDRHFPRPEHVGEPGQDMRPQFPPSNPSLHLHWPVERSQTPLPEHSICLCMVIVLLLVELENWYTFAIARPRGLQADEDYTTALEKHIL